MFHKGLGSGFRVEGLGLLLRVGCRFGTTASRRLPRLKKTAGSKGLTSCPDS